MSDPAALRSVQLGVFALAVYTLTLHPSVPGGDSGELIVAAHTLGISHPPGYPLHALLGHAFTWLPAGSVGWRVNFLSAVCDAGAAALLALTVAEWTECAWAGVLAGGLFAFSPGTWDYAVVTEVFALNNLLVATLIFAAWRFASSGERRWAALAAFTIGLTIANHHTALLFALPLVVWALVEGAALRTPRSIGALALLCAAGALPCLYLPLAAARCPPLYWGDCTSWSGFLDHLLRRHVGTFSLAGKGFGPPQPHLQQTHLFMAYLIQQTLLLGVPLAIAGQACSAFALRGRSLGYTLILAFYFYLGVFTSGANLPLDTPLYVGIQQRFWQQPCLLVCAWIGIGAALACRRRAAVLAPIALVAVALQVGTHYRACDQHDNHYVEAYARAVLGPLAPGALLLTSGDLNGNSIWYMQYCEGFRADVLALDLSRLTWVWSKAFLACRAPELVVPGSRYMPGEPGAYELGALIAPALARRPVYLHGGALASDHSVETKFQLWPRGMCTQLLAPGAAMDFEAWTKESLQALPSYPPPPADRYPELTWENGVRDALWACRQDRAQKLLTVAIERGNDQRLLHAAIDALEEALARFDHVPPQTYKNLGAAYSRLSPLPRPLAERMARLLAVYVSVGPKDDPDLPKIARSLETLPPELRPR